MKRIFLLILLIFILISSAFAIASEPSEVLELNFTAGLIANMGFSSQNVNGMIYPSSSILKEGKTFEFNRSTEGFETGDFYVFCQVFSSDIKAITLRGEPLKNLNDENSAALNWQNTTGAKFSSSSDNQLNLYTKDTSNDNGFSPMYNSVMLNLRLGDITSGISWSDSYSGQLILNIVSDDSQGGSTI